MGESCHEAATAEQVEVMARIVTEACAAGALGLSTSTAPTHNDADGDPVPSRGAHPDELVALAAAVRDVPGTTLECILAGSLNGFTDDEKDLLVRMSLAAEPPDQLERPQRVAAQPRRLSIAARRVRLRRRARRGGGRRSRCPTPCGSVCRSSRGWSSTASPDGVRCSALPVEEREARADGSRASAPLGRGRRVARGRGTGKRRQLVPAAAHRDVRAGEPRVRRTHRR